MTGQDIPGLINGRPAIQFASVDFFGDGVLGQDPFNILVMRGYAKFDAMAMLTLDYVHGLVVFAFQLLAVPGPVLEPRLVLSIRATDTVLLSHVLAHGSKRLVLYHIQLIQKVFVFLENVRRPGTCRRGGHDE